MLVPGLGGRATLVLGCLLYTLSPVLTWACMVTRYNISTIYTISTISTISTSTISTISTHLYSAGLGSLYTVYGLLNCLALNWVMLVTLTTPAQWFPHHRGKVIGLLCAGFGLSPTCK